MFKKPPSVAFKGDTKLRGKEAKQLREATAARFGEDAASALLPPKADVSVRKVGGGSSCVQFVFVDGQCLIFQPDGRATVSEAEIVPTLPALWRGGGGGIPAVLINRPVAQFVFRGADVMLPGVRSGAVAAGEPEPRIGALVVVRAVGNPNACAVGRLRAPWASLGCGGHGEAVEVLHYFGDLLWEACGSVRPEGFVGNRILPTEEGVDALGATASSSDASGDEGEGPAGGEPPAPGKDAAVEAGVAELGAGEDGDGAEGADAAPEDDPQAMSTMLEHCLFQAIRTRLKDKDLPLPGNAIYTQHMRLCRRVGSNVDVKASSFKKLVAFLSHCEDRGWIALKKGSADPVVTKVFRDHPDVSDWKPWPKGETVEVAEANSGADGKLSRIEIQPVFKVTKLKALIEALGGLEALTTEGVIAEGDDGHWVREEVQAALKLYADRRDLWQKNNRKRLEPDDLLAALLSSGKGNSSADGGAHSLDGITEKVLSALPACHRVEAPQAGAVGGTKKSVRTGKPPGVQVRTTTRMGHNVTLLHGLEAYGVDMEALRATLQKTLATNVSIEVASPTTQPGLMVSGFWDAACAKWLAKIGVPVDSVQNQAKKGQQQKKTKQATNIVRG